jgi:hypothetical protein
VVPAWGGLAAGGASAIHLLSSEGFADMSEIPGDPRTDERGGLSFVGGVVLVFSWVWVASSCLVWWLAKGALVGLVRAFLPHLRSWPDGADSLHFFLLALWAIGTLLSPAVMVAAAIRISMLLLRGRSLSTWSWGDKALLPMLPLAFINLLIVSFAAVLGGGHYVSSNSWAKLLSG